MKNLVIPINRREKIYLNEKHSEIVRTFFEADAVKNLLQGMEKHKSDYDYLSTVYYSLFFYWITYLKNLDIINEHDSNLLMIEFFPYFLLYCGMDFRKYLDITQTFSEYHDIFNSYKGLIDLNNYSIEELGYDS